MVRGGGKGWSEEVEEGLVPTDLPTLVILQSNGTRFHSDASDLLILSAVHVAKLVNTTIITTTLDITTPNLSSLPVGYDAITGHQGVSQGCLA